MCMRCEGHSWEEIRRHADLTIRVHGYLIQQVSGDDSDWTYTVGITESWSHPDLVVLEGDLDAQAKIIAALAGDVRDFGGVRPDTHESLDVELVPVHESHLATGLVAAWEDRHSRAATNGDFVQVRLGPAWYCHHRDGAARRLDQPI